MRSRLDRLIAGPFVAGRVAYPPALVAQLLGGVVAPRARAVVVLRRGSAAAAPATASAWVSLSAPVRNASAVAGKVSRRAAVSKLAMTRPTLVPVLCARKCAALRSPEARQTFDSSTRLASSVRPAASTRSPSVSTSSRRQRVSTAEAPGLERRQDAALGRHRRLQLVEHRHRFSRAQEGLTQRDPVHLDPLIRGSSDHRIEQVFDLSSYEENFFARSRRFGRGSVHEEQDAERSAACHQDDA